MRLLITAIGKAKASPETALYDHYVRRIRWPLTCKEHEPKPSAKNKQTEAQALLGACAGYDRIIALDESGKLVSSNDIAQHISGWQQQGNSSFAFIIGGADGLDDALLKQSHAVWSFGRTTWPHMLVRGLLAEQIYRAQTIIDGHPYHRS